MLSYEDILLLHEEALRRDGGSPGILNENAIHSAINQPYQTFGGVDLYEGPVAKAVALGYFLIKAHGFGDGNKRVGFAAMTTLLFQEGYHLVVVPYEGEFMVLRVADGDAKLEEFGAWVEDHLQTVE